ncbi:MAG: hypothetical protein ACXABN_17520, partial [Candidatus Thorarchaeota archaeon]
LGEIIEGLRDSWLGEFLVGGHGEGDISEARGMGGMFGERGIQRNLTSQFIGRATRGEGDFDREEAMLLVSNSKLRSKIDDFLRTGEEEKESKELQREMHRLLKEHLDATQENTQATQENTQATQATQENTEEAKVGASLPKGVRNQAARVSTSGARGQIQN